MDCESDNDHFEHKTTQCSLLIVLAGLSYGDSIHAQVVDNAGVVPKETSGKRTPVYASVQTVAFSPSGELRAIYAPCAPNTEWDGGPFPHWHTTWFVTGETLITFPNVVTGYATFTPDCRIASTDDGRTVVLWDMVKKEAISRIELPSQHFCKTFSPDNKTLATGHDDKTIRLWNISNGLPVRTLVGADHFVYCVAFSPDGKRIAAGDARGSVGVWDIEKSAKIQRLEGHTEQVSAIKFSPDGTTLATASYDHTVRLWNLSSGQTVTTIPRWTLDLSFHPDGKSIAIGKSLMTETEIWDVKTGNRVVELPSRDSGFCRLLAFSPDGNALASGVGFTIRMWKSVQGKWHYSDLEYGVPLTKRQLNNHRKG